MAKKKAKKQTGKSTAKDAEGAKSKAPPPKPVDVLKLDEFAQGIIENHFGYDSPFEKQRKKVERLENELALDRLKLEHLAAPLRAIEKTLNPASLAAIEQTQPWDGQLRNELGRIRLKRKKNYWGNETEPTGAKTWAELKRDGASDEQIGKNIASIGDRNGKEPEFAIVHNDFIHHGVGVHEWDGPKTNLIKGKASLIKEARRLFAIPQPVKKPASPKPVAQKTPSKKKSSKPRSTPAKPAAKSNKKATTKKPAKGTPRSKANKNKPAIEQPAVPPGLQEKWDAHDAAVDAKFGDQAAVPPAKTETANGGDPVAVLAAGGPMMTRTISTRLGKTVDATGAQLRRLLKAGKVIQDGQFWKLPGVDSANGHAAPADNDDSIDGALDLSDNDDEAERELEADGGGTATLTERQKKNRVVPREKKPLFQKAK